MHTYGIAITVFTKESACIPWKANESKRYLDCGQPTFAGHKVSSDTALQRGENKTQSSTCGEKKKQPHRAKQMLFSRSHLFYFPFPPRIWEFATQKQTAGNQDISGVISMHTHTHTENPPRRTEKSRIRCNSPGPGILYTQLGLIRVSSARLLKAASWWCVHSMGTGCEFHIGTPKPLPRAHTWNMTAFPMAPTQVSINQSVGSEYSNSWLPMQCPCGMFRNHSTELCLSRSVFAGSISSIQEPKTGHFYLSQWPQKQPMSHQNENCSIRSNSSK